MTDEEYRDAIKAAAEEYIKPGLPLVPGMRGITLAKPIHFYWLNVTLSAGNYFVDARHDGEAETNFPHFVYSISFDGEADEQAGELAFATDGIKGHLERVRISGEYIGADKDTEFIITLEDLTTWAAANQATDKGDKELASEILMARYRLSPDPIKADEESDAGELPYREVFPQDTQDVRQYIQGTSKTSNPLRWMGIEESGKKGLDVSGRNESPKYVFVTLEENDGLPMMQGTEENTNNAVASLWYAGRRNVTSADIARVAFSVDKPKPTQTSVIEEDMERLSRRVTIDWTQEARGRELSTEDGDKVTELTCTGSLVPNERIDIKTANGRVVKGYRLLSMPLLYKHDASVKQITKVSASMLESAAKKVPSTKGNIVIRTYILRRLARIKKSPTTTPRIRYEAVMDAAAKSNDPKGKNKASVRKTVKGYLEAFVEKGYITSFEEYTAPGEKGVTGVHITR